MLPRGWDRGHVSREVERGNGSDDRAHSGEAGSAKTESANPSARYKFVCYCLSLYHLLFKEIMLAEAHTIFTALFPSSYYHAKSLTTLPLLEDTYPM